MEAPGPLDPEVLRRMRTVFTAGISTRNRTVYEAAAEARGLGCGMQPALPVSVIDAAVGDIMREAGVQQASEMEVEHHGQTLRAVTPEEIADSLAYAMRFNETGKARRTGHEYMSHVAAGQLVQQLLKSGYIIMKRPIAGPRSGER